MQKKFSNVAVVLVCLVFLAGCSLTTKRQGKADLPIPSTGDLPHQVDLPDDGGEGAELSIPNVKIPKIGIVLGPGGARSYAYIGFLRELEKAKIPVDSIAGLEWGALIAALYSVNGKAHEVEWKASKIPNDFAKKGMLSSSVDPRSFADMDQHLKVMFEKTKVEEGKIPFACITDNLNTFKSLMIFKGTYRETLGFCVGHSPLLQSKSGWVSSATQVRYLIDQMAQRGMDYIVLVDVVTGVHPLKGLKVDEATSTLWSGISKSINQNKKYVHHAVTIPISKNIGDFGARKQFINQGAEYGKQTAEKISRQFGL